MTSPREGSAVILIDRDVLTCPVKDVAGTRVLMTVVGGRVVHETPK